MPITDFEGSVRIIGPDGKARAARLTGAVETANPLEAGLGHDETSLAFQRWLQVQVTTPEPLDFAKGDVVFVDGSRRAAVFTERGNATGRFIYAVKLAGS